MRNFLCLVVVTLVAACGVNAEKADQQKQGKVELPDHRGQNNEPLSLTSEDQNLNFTGSLLIWNKEATPAQIQRIGLASRETRRIKSDIVNYYYDEVVPAGKSVAESTKSFEVVAAERAAAIRKGYENLDLVRSVLVPVADGWFNKRLGELRAAGSITDTDKTHAETMFGAYCEMKLWELAISPLATATYMVRPTPLALCEPYYKEKQYFSDVSLCPVEIPAGGQDFFDCLWKDGVFRSALFVEKLNTSTCRPTPVPTDYASRGEALKSWVNSGLLRNILRDNEKVSEQKTYAEDFVAQSFSGTAYSRQLLGKLVDGVAPYEDLGRCRIAMKREDLSDPSIPSSDAWKFAKLDDLKFIVESTEDQASRAVLKLLPSTGSGVQDGQNYKKLAWYIHAFGERKASPGRLPASYSDSKFNLATGVNLTADPAHESTIKTDPAFSEFSDLDDRLTSADIRARYKSASMKLEDAKKNFVTVEKTYKTEKLALLFPNQQESIKAVLDPGVASAFTAFGVNISRRDGLMFVGFKMEESTAALAGCLAVVESAVCPEGSYNANLSFDAVSGRLIITTTLNEPAAFGLKQREVSKLSTYFSRINETELAGRKLELQFDLNRLNGNLEFFTGQAFFRDEKGTTLFQGSTSGDNLSQRLSGNR
jgi:hypothetical protein